LAFKVIAFIAGTQAAPGANPLEVAHGMITSRRVF
jgi:hypothetical protein